MTRQPEHEPLDIWLVEDNEIYRDSIVGLLESSSDIRCGLSASSCEAAIEALEARTPPDIVLMDIGLPGMSGIEGTREIRALAPSTRVLMLTVHEERENVFKAISVGATGYLLKSSRGDEILTAIRQVADGAAPINAYIARKMLDLFQATARAAGTSAGYRLTEREREVLELLVDGLILKQIAARLDVSFHTVDTHVRNIYEKLHVNSRGKAVAKALREGLLER